TAGTDLVCAGRDGTEGEVPFGVGDCVGGGVAAAESAGGAEGNARAGDRQLRLHIAHASAHGRAPGQLQRGRGRGPRTLSDTVSTPRFYGLPVLARVGDGERSIGRRFRRRPSVEKEL